jgi:hypothetical protein
MMFSLYKWKWVSADLYCLLTHLYIEDVIIEMVGWHLINHFNLPHCYVSSFSGLSLFFLTPFSNVYLNSDDQYFLLNKVNNYTNTTHYVLDTTIQKQTQIT